LTSRAAVVYGLALLLVLTARDGVAQQTRSVDGTVRSIVDSTVLAGVRVRVLGTRAWTETDTDGRFTLIDIPHTAVLLAFERIGVMADTVNVPTGVHMVPIFLRPLAVGVSPLIAEAAMPARQRFKELAQTSTLSLEPIEMENLPAVLEPDIGRVAQLTPGTVAKNDYTVGLNVRGGESDQNLIRLDGITVFNPFHLGGLFSTFDLSAVESADIVTGGFPASLGGRLSSVMDVELRQGSQDGIGVRGALSLLSSRVLVDGPIGGSGATFLVGGRRTYADVIAKALSYRAVGYYFADGLAKITVPLRRGRISVTGYWGHDALELPWVEPQPGRDGLDLAFSWGNRLGGLTYVHPIGEAILEHHVHVSQFDGKFGLVPNQLEARNSVRQLAARTSVAFRVATQNDVHVGVGVEDYRIVYESENAAFDLEQPDGIWIGDHRIPYDFQDLALNGQLLDVESVPRCWFGYVDDQWRPFSFLLLRPGVRVEHVDGGAGFTGVSPRFAVKTFITADFALTGSAGRYYQALHSIRDQEVPITIVDFWVGADARTPVAQSDQVVVGFERWFGQDVSLTIEAYTKTYRALPMRNLEDDPRTRGDEFLVANGDAAGVDLLIRRHRGSVRGWLAYSYARATREAAGISFPPAHDRRHTINFVLQTPGPLGSVMSVRWGYGSGLPYTGIVGQWLHRQYNSELHLFERPQKEVVSTVINGERFPHYSRLDVGFRWELHWLGGSWWPYVNVVNVYDRRNVFAHTFDYSRVPPSRSGWSQLPFLPIVGVEVEW